MIETKRIAVIGAGLSGAACAHNLAKAGAKVEVFEKSRGVGGRLATRRPLKETPEFGLDHGAPCAHGLPESFGAPWGGGVVGAPGMNALVKQLLEQDPRPKIHLQTQITRIARGDEDWLLQDASGAYFGPYNAIALATPAPQAHALIGDEADAANAQMAPCWTLLLALETPIQAQEDYTSPGEGPLEAIICNSAKPQRAPAPQGWVAHAHADWSRKNLERAAAEIEPILTEAFFTALGAPAQKPLYQTAHRWRFARTLTPVKRAYWLNPEGDLGLCGDWRLGPNASDAYRSGDMLGQAMAKALA